MIRLYVAAIVIGTTFLPCAAEPQQTPLVAVDSSQTVVGEVLDVENELTTSRRDLVLFRYGASDYLVLRFNSFGPANDLRLFFENDTCTGQAWVESAQFLNRAPFPIGLIKNATLFRVEALSVSNVAVVVSHELVQNGDCIPAVAAPSSAYAASMVGPAPTWTPPFTYILNPSIFWDQFQTGDLTRWSNY